MFDLQNSYIEEDDPWAYILSSTGFDVTSTYHRALQDTSGQLIFWRGMILNTPFIANWEAIR